MDVKSELNQNSNFDNLARTQRFPYKITKDGVKWLLTVSKVLLDTLCEWPVRKNKAAGFVNLFCIASFVCLIVAQIVFILDRDADIELKVDAITGVMCSAEACGRRILSIILAKRLTKILPILYYDFWPSDAAGKALHDQLNKGSWILASSSLFEVIQALAWGFMSGILPLTLHRLPLNTKFWFSYMESPFYELLYIWESFVCLDLPATICVFDFFLLTLIWHCVAQFRLLRKFLQVKFEEIVAKDPGQTSEAMVLVLNVIRRHNNLINTCKEIERMLTVYILILYLGTIGTVCLSSFLMTVMQAQALKAIPYFLGHMSQIFLYCFLGNELILESTALQGAVAHCGWHLLPYNKNLRKSLILVMVRAQRPVTLTVGGFGILNLTSYMKLCQFCFSVYTVLGSAVHRNQ